jgi:site-specific recombinase XerC
LPWLLAVRKKKHQHLHLHQQLKPQQLQQQHQPLQQLTQQLQQQQLLLLTQQLLPLQQLMLSQLTQHQQNNQSIIEKADHWSAFFTSLRFTKSRQRANPFMDDIKPPSSSQNPAPGPQS